MLSTVLILPAALRDTGNAVGEVMGWGPNNYSVALSATGNAPATHWGLHAWTDEKFKMMLDSRVYPPEVEEAGISEASYGEMLDALISSFWPGYEGHFSSVCADNGLAAGAE